MEQRFDEDVMDELAAESPPASADEALDSLEEMDEDGFAAEEAFTDDMQDFDAGADAELLADDNFEEGFEADVGDEFAEDYGGPNALDAMEGAIADALAADDGDEFLSRVSNIITKTASNARQGKRGVGQAHRPIRQDQLVRMANVARGLRADGADEFGALEEMLAFAEDERAVDTTAPIIAGLTINTLRPFTTRLDRASRREFLRSVSESVRTLARRHGPRGLWAAPRVVQAVYRTARHRRLSPRQLPQAMRRTTARVASNPTLVQQLTRAQPRTTSITHRRRVRTVTGVPQHLVIHGPGTVEITIRSR
jgi:hypothetical protein